MGPGFNAVCVCGERERGAELQIRPTKPWQRKKEEEEDREGEKRKEREEREEEEGLSYQMRLTQHRD